MTSDTIPAPTFSLRRLRLHARPMLPAALWIVALLGVKAILEALDRADIYHFSTPLPATLLGAVIGLTYGLLSVGLVLIYRTNRIINFAHGQIGALGSAFFGLIAVRYRVPYWLAFPAALGVAAGTGAAAEIGVVRRLRKAPRLMTVVATLGVGQFLLVFSQVINSQAAAGSIYPEPSGLPAFTVGALQVTPAYSGMLLLSPLVVVAIAVFLRRSRHGLAIRGAADNPEAARMSGIFASRMSSLAWAIAGALSAFSAILTAPTQGFVTVDAFGPALLLRAMTGAVIARMSNLPQALVAGIGLGVLEQLLLWNYPRSGLVEVALFGVILVALLLQRRRGGRDEERGSWAAVQAFRPLPELLRQFWLVRNLGRLTSLGALGLAAALPLFITNSDAVTITGIMGFAIIGLAIGILTGLGGQLTLGHFAIGAIGAVISFAVSSRVGNFPLALLYAGLGAGLASVVLGLPALRVRGLMLTVTTLSFALATPAWLLAQPWMLGGGRDPGRPIVFGHPLSTGRSYYYFALALLVLSVVLSYNVRRSGFGRLLVAVRDNEDNARAFTVGASAVKVQGYLFAGFLAGIGGATYGHALSSIGATTFPVKASIDVVVMTVIGGVSMLSGPILGALFVLGIPAFLPLDSAGLAATQFGQLILILYVPGGLVQLLQPLRDRLARRIAAHHGVDIETAYRSPASGAGGIPATAAPLAVSRRYSTDTWVHLETAYATLRPGHRVLLQADELRKRFGGVTAVDGVSLSVRAGETVGLIGPNGAGKTSTFELLGGFTSLDSGSVIFDRRDVTRMSPEQRGRLGLIRSFQDAALFPSMTVLDCVALAHERVMPTGFLSSVAGWTHGERRKTERARELVATMGLDGYRDKQVQELSTGTRRICEIACLVALNPTLLLLDEPSSGIAQRETEALGQLLVDLKMGLNLALLIIEHDIPLIMGISDRIIAMADGRIISQGTPEAVRSDPVVVEAYLGGRIEAIERSGAVTRAGLTSGAGADVHVGMPS